MHSCAHGTHLGFVYYSPWEHHQLSFCNTFPPILLLISATIQDLANTHIMQTCSHNKQHAEMKHQTTIKSPRQSRCFSKVHYVSKSTSPRPYFYARPHMHSYGLPTALWPSSKKFRGWNMVFHPYSTIRMKYGVRQNHHTSETLCFIRLKLVLN